jgi:hypothetical protein
MKTLDPTPTPPAPPAGPGCSKYKHIETHFTEAELEEHRSFKKKGHHYLLESRFFVLISSPVIWMCAIPIIFTDIVGTIYQAICFPIYGIPKVHRREYVKFDRRHLGYLNFFEKANCEYCAYVNGILGYFREIAARTEQHWCPIKHLSCGHCAHSRYDKFLEYGDAREYRQSVEKIRRDYGDIDPNFSA